MSISKHGIQADTLHGDTVEHKNYFLGFSRDGHGLTQRSTDFPFMPRMMPCEVIIEIPLELKLDGQNAKCRNDEKQANNVLL